jgi:hypothetical protein
MQDTIGRFRTNLEAELLRLRHEQVDKTTPTTRGAPIATTTTRTTPTTTIGFVV